eukprot:g4246.t1
MPTTRVLHIHQARTKASNLSEGNNHHESSSPSASGGFSSAEMLAAAISKIPEASRRQFELLFKDIDVDKSGTLTADEMVLLFRDLGEPIQQKEMELLFSLIDADASGEIDFVEFQLLMWRLSGFGLDKNDPKHPHYGYKDISELEKELQTEYNMESRYERFRYKMHLLMDQPSTSLAAWLVSMLIMLLIIISVAAFCLESVRSIQTNYSQLFFIIEAGCSWAFTMEYILRLWGSPSRKKFFFNFLNAVDFIAILPYYIELISGSAGGSFLRVIRLLRIARVFKFSRYLVWMRLLATAFISSLFPFMMVLTVLLMSMVLFACLLYDMERNDWDESVRQYIAPNGEPSMYQSIPSTLYFCLIGMTTVGYGDQWPRSAAGQILTGIMCFYGVMLIAIPISTFSGNFNHEFQKMTKEKSKATIIGMEKKLHRVFSKHHTSLHEQLQEHQRKKREENELMVEKIQEGFSKRASIRTYDEFVEETVELCVEAIDRKAENFWASVRRVERKLRMVQFSRLEDIWQNWFDQPIGVLMNDSTLVRGLKQSRQQSQDEE